MASFLSTFLFIFVSLFGMVSCQLSSSNFYLLSCPLALTTIFTEVNAAVLAEPRMGASLLRLHFHDCFVNGCDASILLDDKTGFVGEKTAAPNANSVRGYEVIDKIKSLLEVQCQRTVSCADILAVAARDSVVALGGASWTVQLGRKDSLTASLDDANANLPSPFSDLSTLISAFSTKGFTTTEMVALSGAHSIGKARCQLFRTRIYNESNIDPTFAASMKNNCPSVGDDDKLSFLDSTTPAAFDNFYFKNLKDSKGLLHSDQELYNNGSTDSIVDKYCGSPSTFLIDFANAMKKMGNLSPLIGSNSEVRSNCRMVN